MLINKTEILQTVQIVTADGQPDSINLQPRGRAIPPEGSTIDPIAYSSYAKTVAGIEAYAPAQEAPVEEAGE